MTNKFSNNLELQLKKTNKKVESLSLLNGQNISDKVLRPVHEIFTTIASINPEDVAIISTDSGFLTYKQIDSWSNNIAIQLRLRYSKTERVAIISKNSADTVVAILSAMKAGLVYVVVDFLSPIHRIKKILSDTGVSAVLTSSDEKINTLEFNIHCISQLKNISTPKTDLLPVMIEDNAYIIYTSGSTGKSKGVLINHKSLSTSNIARNIVYPEKDTFLVLSPFFCDSSLAGLWGSFTLGGTLVLTSYEENRDPELIIELIKKYNVNTMLCVPSLYSQILKCFNQKSLNITNLKNIIVAGETLDNNLIKRHFTSSCTMNTKLFNEYGPSEATIWATYIRFDKYHETTIGLPIPGISLYVLDEEHNLVPKGKKGELFIGGMQVAVGYFNNPSETKKCFLKDNFCGNSDSMMYKTGDLVKMNDDGTLEFLGRKDNQVKVRGYRVEIEYIEKQLNNIPGIEKAIVVVMNNSDVTDLVGCIISSEEFLIDQLVKKLAYSLPQYMIPARFYRFEEFPTTSNCKIDRKKLLKIVTQRDRSISDKTNDTTLPNDYFISLVLEVWRKVLNIKDITLDVNFFDMGGHSLTIFNLQEMLQIRTGKLIPIVELFRNTTVIEQAKLIQKSNTVYDN